jgi:hypothetical protein
MSVLYGQKNNYNDCFDFSRQQTKHFVPKRTILNIDVMVVPIFNLPKSYYNTLFVANIGLQKQLNKRCLVGASIGLLAYDFETVAEVSFCVIPEIRWFIQPTLTGLSLGCKSILFDDVGAYKTKGGIILPYFAYTTKKKKQYKEYSMGGIKYPNSDLWFVSLGLRLGFNVH